MRMLLVDGVGGRVGLETAAACLAQLPAPGQNYAHCPTSTDARINEDTMWWQGMRLQTVTGVSLPT